MIWAKLPMVPTDTTTLRAILSVAGYSVMFRSHAWFECLVVGETERWFGCGETEDEALEHAVGRMLPSHVGRFLLARASAPTTQTERSLPAIDDEAMPAATKSETRPSGARDAPAERSFVRHRTPKDASKALDKILHDIETKLDTFARLAPDRQRALMLIWICQARTHAEALPGEAEVERRAGAVARRLGELAKSFWPGSVRALQLAARPSDACEPGGRGGERPQSWADAAVRAEPMLHEQTVKAAQRGLDGDGWAEAPDAKTENVDPERAFSDAVAALDKALAGMGAEKVPPSVEAGVEALAATALRLRRVRRRVHDGVAWGAAMGKLRALAAKLGAQGVTLRRAIDPQVLPRLIKAERDAGRGTAGGGERPTPESVRRASRSTER